MSTLVVTNLSLGAGGLPDGSVLTSDIADGAITGPKIAAGAVSASELDGNQTGSAPIYGARAWVNFDGTRDSGGALSTANTNRLIRASGNVTSVLRNGTGDYTVNFTTPMANANYVGVATSNLNSTGGHNRIISAPFTTAPTTSAFRLVSSRADTAGIEDQANISIVFFS